MAIHIAGSAARVNLHDQNSASLRDEDTTRHQPANHASRCRRGV